MKAGDKVICIKKGIWDGEPDYGVTFPRFGDELTIRDNGWSIGGLRFEEIRNPEKDYIDFIGECEFHECRFRKIETYSATENCVNFNTVEEGLEQTERVKIGNCSKLINDLRNVKTK
jgi:hypothetical protein